MMNNFIFSQKASKMLFHNKTMLKNISTTIGIRMIRTAYFYVAITMIASASLPVPMFAASLVAFHSFIPGSCTWFKVVSFLRMFMEPFSITFLATELFLAFEQYLSTDLAISLGLRGIIACAATKPFLSFSKWPATPLAIFSWIAFGFSVAFITAKTLLPLSQRSPANLT